MTIIQCLSTADTGTCLFIAPFCLPW